jgi:YegS/Rv2252/BmrU family lipid kinase
MTSLSDPAHLYTIIFNTRSGSVGANLTAAGLIERFRAGGLSVVGECDRDTPLAALLQAAVQGKADVVVAAGGDGTVTAVARALVDTEKVLAVLPLGTANLLARDLAVPLDIDDAIGQLKNMVARRIDVGEVNGTVFLHKVVLGFMPAIAAARERLRDHVSFSTIAAFLWTVLRRMLRARRITVELGTSDGKRSEVRAAAIAVSNNVYDEGAGRFFSRSRLDAGYLGVYVLRRAGLAAMLRIAVGMLIGRWKKAEELSISTVLAITINSRKRKLVAMIDGEVAMFDTPLSIRIRPKALRVLAPESAYAGGGPPQDRAG